MELVIERGPEITFDSLANMPLYSVVHRPSDDGLYMILSCVSHWAECLDLRKGCRVTLSSSPLSCFYVQVKAVLTVSVPTPSKIPLVSVGDIELD